MLLATLLALGAAVLHAGWNLSVRQSGDRWIALWGQMFMAGVGCAIVIAANGGIHPSAIGWATASGATHVLYVWWLARAYDLGDFSTTYPIARGGGALLAAAGGVLFLNDNLTALMLAGIFIAVIGIFLLSGRADNSHVRAALLVSLSIGTYSVIDSQGSRHTGGNLYPLSLFVTGAFFISLHGLALGRGRDMNRSMRAYWKRFALMGTASTITYWMVLIAVQHAPVGYVTVLRESSVVIVALVGTRLLKEGDTKRRIAAAAVVVLGLAVLVAGR